MHFGRFFTGQITAAGKVPPAKVFVIGAGVAGLAAIGAASGLGAIVRANDTRAGSRRPGQVAGRRVRRRSTTRRKARGVGGYAKVMSEGFQQAQARGVREAGEGSRHHHHDRADSRASPRRS